MHQTLQGSFPDVLKPTETHLQPFQNLQDRHRSELELSLTFDNLFEKLEVTSDTLRTSCTPYSEPKRRVGRSLVGAVDLARGVLDAPIVAIDHDDPLLDLGGK